MKLLLTLLLTAFIGGNILVLQPPLGLDMYMPVPEANPLTHDKVALGRKLFFDKRLSRDGTLACASCHDPQRGFSDARAVARGINGAEGPVMLRPLSIVDTDGRSSGTAALNRSNNKRCNPSRILSSSA